MKIASIIKAHYQALFVLNRACLLALFVLCSIITYAQSDSLSKRGTIKIGKQKDTVYIQASARFNVYQPSEIKTGNSYKDFVKASKEMNALRSSSVIEPFPLVPNYTIPFDYNAYFNQKITGKSVNLYGKEFDTVKIEIGITEKGKVYFKDISRLQRINNTVVVYDNELDGYEINQTHQLSMKALKEISKWEPAYLIQPVKAKYKKTTVIKPKKQKLNALGLITIIFSSSPIIE
ncbi:MAG: hypothetical protein JNL69_13200 [Bacteroidia bacterium]|nr:hypothetical protein [Bacteroidia bacterium]